MNLNSLIFPAPESSYTATTFPGQLVWIPHLVSLEKSPIPCIFLQQTVGSSKLLIYFHGNAEDAGSAYDLCSTLRNKLQVHVLIVEYPGYGLHPGKPSEKSICATCDSVVLYLQRERDYSPSDIILLGRSIGSGPACYLAGKERYCCLVLISAYTSIRSVVRHVAGRLAGMLVSQRFKNTEVIQSVTCPVFLLHGRKDSLIPCSHSEELHSKCRGASFLHTPSEMDHNEFHHLNDLMKPLRTFLLRCGIDTRSLAHERCLLLFPEELYRLPPDRVTKAKAKR